MGLLAALLAAAAALLLAGPAAAGTGEPSDELLPTPEQPPEQVEEQADDILSGAEFQEPEPTLFERAERWVLEQIAKVLESLGGGGQSSLLGWAVLIPLVALVVFLLVRLARTVQPDPESTTEISVERARSAAQWADAADEAEAVGRWKEGLRCRYRGLVADLVALGVLDEVAGRTTGEHRREVAKEAPEAAAPFSGAAELFDRAWYGDRETGAEQSAQFQALGADAVAAARRRNRRPVDELVGAHP
jgi:hypothetical protein